MDAFYLYKQINCVKDYTKIDLNQKIEKTKTLLFNTKQTSMCLQLLFSFIFAFCPIKNPS